MLEYNEVYERTKDHLREVLHRPDQAVTWAPAAQVDTPSWRDDPVL
jgi:hypothetical protein